MSFTDYPVWVAKHPGRAPAAGWALNNYRTETNKGKKRSKSAHHRLSGGAGVGWLSPHTTN